MTDWTELTYVVADVEGNGHQPPDLVELATVPIVAGVIGEPSAWLVRPPHPIGRFATKIHGIKNADVAEAAPLEQVRGPVLQALDAQALIAHNAHVDVGVLSRELDGWVPAEVFDTLKLARRLLPGEPSYRLGALVERLKLDQGLPDGLAPHRATYDALVAARLFVHLMTKTDAAPLTLARARGEDDTEVTDDALF